MNCKEYLDEVWQAYRLVAVLSQRNGAQVLRIRHQKLGRDLVLRHYAEPVRAYERLAKIRQQHLPEVYECLTLTDGQIVLEEYIEGVTVAQVLENGLYTWQGAKAVLHAVCAAVETLHGLNLVHRDIKPENVIITKEGGVKLLDLNAARQVQMGKTVDTQVLGTIGYASPEQLGITQTDRRTDIYALGVLLNVMLTGQHPSKQLMKGRPGKIVLRCTQIDPESRYQTAQQLKNAL